MEMKEKAEIVDPLVSIIVITYNSAKYVLETLESAKVQTYQNIELIVSDDCSTDDTVEICRDWINENGERFVRTELITVEKNTGIPANCNRGVKTAKGEWVKLIAGDDLLVPRAITYFIQFALLNPNQSIYYSDVDVFGLEENPLKIESVRKWVVTVNKIIKCCSLLSTAEEQYKELLIHNIVIAPSIFIKRRIMDDIGWYDEKIKLLEDYPFWIKATKKGYFISVIREKLIRYRVGHENVQSNIAFKISHEIFFQKYILKNIFVHIFTPMIHQLKPKKMDFLLVKLLILTSIPQRFIYKKKKRKSKCSENQ